MKCEIELGDDICPEGYCIVGCKRLRDVPTEALVLRFVLSIKLYEVVECGEVVRSNQHSLDMPFFIVEKIWRFPDCVAYVYCHGTWYFFDVPQQQGFVLKD